MIYFHLGLPRTGTSALQRALASIRGELFDHGILYPTEWCPNGISHHNLPRELRSANNGLHSPFMTFLSNNLDKDVFISSEEFTKMVGPTRVMNLIAFFNACNAITTARSIIALRRADLFCESMYLQVVRSQGTERSIEQRAVHHRAWMTKFFQGLGRLKYEFRERLTIWKHCPGFNSIQAAGDLVGLGSGVIQRAIRQVRLPAKLSWKSHIVMWNIDTPMFRDRLGRTVDKRALDRIMRKGDLRFKNDLQSYRILPHDTAEELHSLALKSSRQNGVDDYAAFFGADTIDRYTSVTLSLDHLTEDDYARLRAYARVYNDLETRSI